MFTQDYEYECMRAELLGLEKPEKSKFNAEPTEKLLNSVNDCLPDVQDMAAETEHLGHVSGGFTELNSLLKSTKKKLDKYTGMYGGRFGLHFKGKSSESMKDLQEEPTNTLKNDSQVSNKPSDMKDPKLVDFKIEEVEKQIDKLDLILSRAEHAQQSLADRNKQIKKILRR